jgi:hypothetical protein
MGTGLKMASTLRIDSRFFPPRSLNTSLNGFVAKSPRNSYYVNQFADVHCGSSWELAAFFPPLTEPHDPFHQGGSRAWWKVTGPRLHRSFFSSGSYDLRLIRTSTLPVQPGLGVSPSLSSVDIHVPQGPGGSSRLDRLIPELPIPAATVGMRPDWVQGRVELPNELTATTGISSTPTTPTKPKVHRITRRKFKRAAMRWPTSFRPSAN